MKTIAKLTNTWAVIFMAIFLTVTAGFITGCSDSDDGDDPPASGSAADPADEAQDIDDALVHSLASMNQQARDVNHFRTLIEAADYMNLAGDRNSPRSSRRVDVTFKCGTLHVQDDVMEFTFLEGQGCRDLNGTVKIRSTGQGRNQEWELEYSDFNAGNCAMNGVVHYRLGFDEKKMTGDITYNNFSVCGETRSGSLTYVLDMNANQITYDLKTDNYAYSGDISVAADFDYIEPETENGSEMIRGTATVTVNGTVYTLSTDGVSIDPECGLPNSGTVTVSRPDKDPVTVDFSGTNCNNQSVTYFLNGVEHTCQLGTVVDLSKAGDKT